MIFIKQKIVINRETQEWNNCFKPYFKQGKSESHSILNENLL